MKKGHYLIFAALILLVPHIVQYIFNFNLMIGTQSYENARVASLIIRDGLNYHDSMGFGRESSLDPYQVIIALIGRIIGVELANRIVPFILGILFCLIFYEILARSGVRERTISYTMFFMLVSPVFIYNFTVSQQYSIICVLLALAYLMFFIQKYLAALFFMLSCIFDPRLYIVSIIPVFFLLWRKELVLFIVLAIFGLAGSVFRLLIGLGRADVMYPDVASMVYNNMVFFGAETGFTLFFIILALIGFSATWNMKKQFAGLYLSILMFIISTLYIEPRHNILLNFVIVFFAARGFVSLQDRNWQLADIRWMVFLIVIAGSIVSCAFYMKSLSARSPQIELVEAMKFIGEDGGDGTVLAYPGYSEWVEYFSARPALLSFSDHGSVRYDDSVMLLGTIDRDTAYDIIRKYDIGYILIDDSLERMSGLEIRLLMEHDDHFSLVLDHDDIYVWKVITD